MTVPVVQTAKPLSHVSSKVGFSMPTAAELNQLTDFCKVMATAPFYRNLGPGGIMAIYLTAKEHNVPFMASLNGGMYTFDGKVTFSAQLINAMIINAGHRADVIHLDEQKCIIHFKRGDRRDSDYKGFIFEYNIKQAEKAGYLSKANWKSSPKDMLFSRCLTGGGRKHIPEVFVGVLVAGELVGDDSDGKIIPDIPIEALSVQGEIAQTETVNQIGYEKAEGFDEFKFKHISQHGPTVLEYVKITCEKANLSEIQVWNSAMKNEEIFIDRYQKWKDKKLTVEVPPQSNDGFLDSGM